MYFFAFNLEKITPDRMFYTGSARGARDKYEVGVEAAAGGAGDMCCLHFSN